MVCRKLEIRQSIHEFEFASFHESSSSFVARVLASGLGCFILQNEKMKSTSGSRLAYYTSTKRRWMQKGNTTSML